jgi:hypothetical protein
LIIPGQESGQQHDWRRNDQARGRDDLAHRRPVACPGSLPGKLVRKQLSFPERAMVLALRVPEGDFRDFTEIRAWASEIADALDAES